MYAHIFTYVDMQPNGLYNIIRTQKSYPSANNALKLVTHGPAGIYYKAINLGKFAISGDSNFKISIHFKLYGLTMNIILNNHKYFY